MFVGDDDDEIRGVRQMQGAFWHGWPPEHNQWFDPAVKQILGQGSFYDHGDNQ